MSLSNLANLCSHLNNVSKARLSLASIPNTKLHLALVLAMQRDGYFSSVVRGGPSPPPPHLLLGHPDPLSEGKEVELGGKTSKATRHTKFIETEPVTQSNVASRRLWLGMKYWQEEPVLGHMSSISKPKRKLNLDVAELRRIIRGTPANQIAPLRSPGETMYLATNRGLMESRQCVELNVGGLVLCRVE